jgi:hypothetical protein
MEATGPGRELAVLICPCGMTVGRLWRDRDDSVSVMTLDGGCERSVPLGGFAAARCSGHGGQLLRFSARALLDAAAGLGSRLLVGWPIRPSIANTTV